MDNILSFLGLARRGSHLAVGEEPVGAAARAKDARLILLASDAAGHTQRRARHFAEIGACLCLSVPYRKEELGSAVGRNGIALVAVTDVGFANSLVQKLLAQYGDDYAEAAARMQVKADRAAERKREAVRHEKNRRKGKSPSRRQK